MKLLLSFFFFLFVITCTFSQNLVPNNGFETVSGSSPYSFSSNQVSSWYSGSLQAEARDYFQCPSTSYFLTAPEGSNFAKVAGRFRALSVPLLQPVMPGEKLNISFKAAIPQCSDNQEYEVEFYLANYAPTGTTFYPVFETHLAKCYVAAAGNVWQNKTATGVSTSNIVVPSVGSTCSYQYLIIFYKIPGELDGPGQVEERVFADLMMFDDIHVEPCASDMNVTATATNDQGGICADVLFNISTTGGTGQRFYWFFGDGSTLCNTSGTVTHSYLEMGIYPASVVIVDDEGCMTKVNITVIATCARCENMSSNFHVTCKSCTPHYEIDPKTQQQILVGYSCTYDLVSDAVASTGGTITTWQWIYNGTVVSTSQNPTNVTLTASAANSFQGKLCLFVRDNNGCQVIYCKEMTLPCRDEHGRPAAGNGVDFQVIPNPSFAGPVSLALSDALRDQVLQVFVMDLEGRVLRQVEIPASNAAPGLDLADLKNGVYLVSIRHAGGMSTQKIVIQN